MLTIPNFRAERCVRYHYAYSECSRCADACPHAAIRLFDAGAEVLTEACRSCALCAAACPTEALTVPDISAETLLKQADTKRQMRIACAPSEAEADAVVPCLGALNPVVLATLSQRGIELSLHGMSHCEQCEHKTRGPAMIAGHQAARGVLCGVGEPEQWATLSVAADDAAAASGEHDAERRGLFRRFIGKGMDVVSGKLEAKPAPLKAIRATAPFLPERKVLLNALYADGEEAVTVQRHPALPAEDWRVMPGCTHCEACVRVCPTGALQLLENTGAWRLAVLNDRCVACDVCAEVCQPKVLQPINAPVVIVNKRKGRLLESVGKQRCTRCDRVFVNEHGTEICPICAGDDVDFAEIFG